MNIGAMLRSIIGDAQVSESKQLELKIGQVVRGVLLQMLDEHDALININGMQVRARLESPMKQGQATMLQVQPESAGGPIVLKPLGSAPHVQIAEESLTDLLRNVGLSDDKNNRMLVQQMNRDGVPVTKDNANALKEAAAAVPPQVDREEWLQSAVLAFKRGLPVTPATVGALHQAAFGKPLHEQLQQLEAQVRGLLQEPPPQGEPASGGGRELLQRLAAALGRVAASSAGALADAAAAARPAAQPPAAGAAPAQQAPAPGGAAAQARPAAEPAAQQLAAPREAAPPQASAAAQRPAAPAAAAQAAPPGEAAASAQPRAADAGAGAGGAARAEAPTQPLQGEATPRREETWLARTLKALGLDHEHAAFKPLAQQEPHAGQQVRQAASDLALPALAASQPDATADGAKSAVSQQQDSLKGLLLTIAQSDDVPPAIKESAGQLVQQITGQQLLLTPDRGSMFTHVTMFIPMFNKDGEQTAAIHIQSRKGKRGELDADNCRLLFDLRMRSLGNTIVDVQVVNKIVSLKVHNDHPAIAALLEQGREQVTAALETLGYQFLSMKAVPLPDRLSSIDDSVSSSALSGVQSSASSMYASKPYKGVDLRV